MFKFQFHQHFKSSFSANCLAPKKYEPQLQVKVYNFCKKSAHKKLVILTTDVGEIDFACLQFSLLETLLLLNFSHKGSISPNSFAKQKVASARRLAKNSPFNFTNKAVRLKLGQNLPKYVRHLSNAVCQKKASNPAHKKCC